MAFDRSGYALASRDLSHWTVPNAITTTRLTDVAFGDNRFVATGNNGTILIYAACSTWAPSHSPASGNFNAVAFGNAAFVVAGDSGTLLSSPDCRTWSRRNPGTTRNLDAVRFGNGMFVAAAYGDTGLLFESKDGATWTRSKTEVEELQNLLCGNECFVAAGVNAMFVSTDGKNWEKAITGKGRFSTSYFNGNHFVVIRHDDDADTEIHLSSGDGKWWKQTEPMTPSSRETVSFGTGACKIIGRQLFWQSPDSSLFSINSKIFQPVSVTYGDSHFVGVGDNGKIASLRARYTASERLKRKPLRSIKPESFERKLFLGKIDFYYAFLMKLTAEGKNVTGEYRYLRQPGALQLKGHRDTKGVFYLTEYPDDGKTTGSFIGKMSDSGFIGEWRNPDSSKRLYFEATASSEEWITERLKSLRAEYNELRGRYSATWIGGSAGPDPYNCDYENGDWECSGWIVGRNGIAEPIGEYSTKLCLGIVESIVLEIKDDLTIELKESGKKILNMPLTETELLYFEGNSIIAKNIEIRDLDIHGGNYKFVLTYSKDSRSFSLEGNPKIIFSKVQDSPKRNSQ